MTKTREFTDVNFRDEVLNADGPVLVDFWAEWCGPCRAVGPTIEELAGEFGDTVKVGMLNVDENPGSPRRFGINSIPSVLIFKDGKVVETLVGVQPKANYQQVLEQAAA